MEPVSAITAALVAGATAAASGVASDAVKDAYQGLKTLLIDGYGFASAKLLEKKPSSTTYQQAVEDEIKETPALVADKSIYEKITALSEAIEAEPAETISHWGIDLRRLRVAGNFKADNIEDGITGEDWDIGGDATFSGLSRSKRPGNR